MLVQSKSICLYEENMFVQMFKIDDELKHKIM